MLEYQYMKFLLGERALDIQAGEPDHPCKKSTLVQFCVILKTTHSDELVYLILQPVQIASNTQTFEAETDADKH